MGSAGINTLDPVRRPAHPELRRRRRTNLTLWQLERKSASLALATGEHFICISLLVRSATGIVYVEPLYRPI